MRKVAISDCDHVGMDEEKAVFEAANVQMDLFQCRTEEDLIACLPPYGVVGNQYAPFTEKVFQRLKNLKGIVRYGVGVDNIDLAAAARHGVAVSNVPDYGVQEVASHALMLMMALTRKLIPVDRSVRGGGWAYQVSQPIYRYQGLTAGIIGLGRIGGCFSELVRPLGMRVLATDPRYPETAPQRYAYVEMTSLEWLLREADVVSIHCPLETAEGLISQEQLQAMKNSAFLVNVSRGGIVQEAALEKALENQWIAGAACDVLAKEPPAGVHPLLRFDNFICTPHMAWYSVQAASDLKRKLAEEMLRYLRGDKPLNKLNSR